MKTITVSQSALLALLLSACNAAVDDHDGSDFGSVEQPLVSGATCDPANAAGAVKPAMKAMLDTIAHCEGTEGRGKDGYNVTYAYHYLSSCTDHPRNVICSGICSSAAGRYQFLERTWDSLGYSNFWPENQDRGGAKLVGWAGVKLPDTPLDYTSFQAAMTELSGTWMSLPPGRASNQPSYSRTEAWEIYCGYTKCVRSVAPIGEGSFIRDKASGEVYVVAGNAPLYVADSKLIGSATVSDVDTAFINKLSKVPRDGTFVVAGQEVYVIVGGAPLYVSDWDNVGGSGGKPTIRIDVAALNGAGATSGRYSHLNKVPADGSRFQGSPSGEAYVVAGGAPIYITAWDNVGGPPGVALTKVDDAAIAGAGADSGRYSHLRKVPQDGTFVQGGVSKEAYVIAGGAPLYITSWSNVGGSPKSPIPVVDDAILNGSGAVSGRYSHVNRLPADGTFVTATSGEVYRIQGGAPIYVSTWNAFTSDGRALSSTRVDQAVVDHAGNTTDHRFQHLLMLPKDGTKLLGSSGAQYVVSAGKPLADSGSERFSETAKVDQYAIDNAGGSGRLAHLLAP